MTEVRAAYAAAGVDVAAGDRAVDLMRAFVESTRRPEVVGGLGGFAGAVSLPAGLRDPLLVSATDGVGTKTALAGASGRYEVLGIDLVAMCVDDVVCSGAAPLFFLDYIATGRIDPQRISDVVAGVARGCREAGCALVGGETAEHPGLMDDDAIDLAGFCVGVVERDRVIDGRTVAPGDAILGIRTSGLHANGYSLVRSVLTSQGLGLADPYAETIRDRLGEIAAVEALVEQPVHVKASLADVLLAPTPIYASTVLALRDGLERDGHELGGLAHITGGGLPGNVPRALPDALGARLDPGRWQTPWVMRLIGDLAGIDDAELRATFNGGLGMVAVLSPEAIPLAIRILSDRGFAGTLVGEVVPRAALGGRRYVEGPLEALDTRSR
jgi:phosphoribosylformylglycinamidine cyclo-ligase